MKKEVKKSVLSRRYVELETDIYQRKRYKKGEIYKAIMGYIEILEEQLEFEEDSFASAPTTTKKGYTFVSWNYDFN